eukprot:jgi/Ulvmu1/7493/UM037_0037.1
MRYKGCQTSTRSRAAQQASCYSRHGCGYVCRPIVAPSRRLARSFAAGTSVELAQPKQGVDWDNLGFGINNVAPNMFLATYSEPTGWSAGNMQPYGPLSMDPAAQVLNYGQALFEGMKAQRTPAGEIVVFRPTCNAERMRQGAARMSMVAPPEELFLEGVMGAVRENAEMVPPLGKGSLYLRPLLIGTGPIIGLGPSSEYVFTVFGTAVGSYFKGGQMQPIDLMVETQFHRAAPGGMGSTKCAGNYSPVLLTQLEAKKQGFADVVYLDAQTNTCLEEVSSCNIFTVKGNVVSTPPLKGTILPGVTRRSVIALLEEMGYAVKEEDVPIDQALEADEVFTTGTAVVISSVGSLTYQGSKTQFCGGEVGPVTGKVYDKLTKIQSMTDSGPNGWVVPVR